MNNINDKINMPQTCLGITPKHSKQVNNALPTDKVSISGQKEDSFSKKNFSKNHLKNTNANDVGTPQIALKLQGNDSKTSLHVIKGDSSVLNSNEKSLSKEDAIDKNVVFNLNEEDNFLFADPSVKQGPKVDVIYATDNITVNNTSSNTTDKKPKKDDIIISASDKDDVVNVRQTKAGKLIVDINGEKKTYTKEEAGKLVFDLKRGNDKFVADESVTYDLNIRAKSGNNEIITGAGNDIIEAGNGINNISVGGGSNTVTVGNGNNTVSTIAKENNVAGGMLNKLLPPSDTDTTVDINTIKMGDGNNIFNGGSGKDNVTAGNGNNEINGGDEKQRSQRYDLDRDGNGKMDTADYYEVPDGDTIIVGDGNNKINGGAGADVIIAGNGHNQIYGGNEDTLKFYKSKEGKNLHYGDRIIVGHGDNQIYGEDGNDIITAGDGNNEIYGGNEIASNHRGYYDPKGDVIRVGDGNNKIVGGTGVETILSGKGNNEIYNETEITPIVDRRYKCIATIKEPKTAKTLKENIDYTSILEERYKNADPRVRVFYDKHKKDIIIFDVDTQVTARYSPSQGNVTVNITEDARHRPSAGTTYYHEIGHLMDDKLKDEGCASENKVFTNALRKDVEDFVTKYCEEHKDSVTKYMEEHKDVTEKDAAYAVVGELMSGSDSDKYRGVSDVYGGLTENKAQGSWGHSNEYWTRKYAVNREAFANMFEVSMGGDPEALKHMKDMLPTAYEEFIKMVEAGT